MNQGWTTAAGEAVDLYDMPVGSLELTADVSGLDLDRRSLCLKSVDTVFDVYADGQLIYSYRPQLTRRLGASYGMYVHAVAIPEGASVLGLRVESVFPGAPASLKDVAIEQGAQYMNGLFRNNLWSFGRSTVILLAGLLFLLAGIFGRVVMNSAGLDFISLGVFCVLIGFGGYNDTLLLQVLTRHPALIRDVVEAFMRLVKKGRLRAPDDDGGGSMENIENIRGGIRQ